jgi:hypothetical protein
MAMMVSEMTMSRKRATGILARRSTARGRSSFALFANEGHPYALYSMTLRPMVCAVRPSDAWTVEDPDRPANEHALVTEASVFYKTDYASALPDRAFVFPSVTGP